MDLELLEPFLNLLGIISRSGVNEKIEEMYRSSMILFEQAKTAEQSSLMARTQRQLGKGDPGAKESVEEFLARMEHIRSGDNTEVDLISGDAWQ